MSVSLALKQCLAHGYFKKNNKANHNNTFVMKLFYVLNEITNAQAFTLLGSGVKGKIKICIALFFKK